MFLANITSKKEVEATMKEQDWNMAYNKVGTKIMNKQRKCQAKARKAMNFAWHLL